VGIPIVIGVTGHRALREQDIPVLRQIVSSELTKLTAAYTNSSFVMLNSIASGADMLCAEAALALGMRLVCSLPMPASEYRKDFSGEDLAAFDALLQKADKVFVAPDIERKNEDLTRDYHYRQAGIYISAHSHLLLALWDGSAAKQDGCGTAEVVDFMLNANYQDKYNDFKATNDGAVLHVFAPRESDDDEALVPRVSLLENEPGCLEKMLKRTDAFNADAKRIPERKSNAEPLVPDDTLVDMPDSLKQIHAVYQAADRLSLWFQARYLRAMKYFSLFGALLVLFFLLYDEMESNLFLLCYGILILVYVLQFVRSSKIRAHEKHLQYRMLSETMRAQFYLRAAGMRENIGNAFTWTQKQESTWVKDAVSALLVDELPKQEMQDDTIKALWIDGQFTYHQSAFRRTSKKHRLSESTATWMMIISIALFFAVLTLEFFFDSFMTQTLFTKPFPPILMYHNGQIFTLRNLMKILLGAISAITVFVANYYGKLSLGRKSIDHERMFRLYAAAKSQYESNRISHHQVFHSLAREEIIEIGNWFSYCRENSPSFRV